MFVLIQNQEILCTKIKQGTNKKNLNYFVIDILVLSTSDMFTIITYDLELAYKLQVMNKYNIDLELTSNKYGLKLSIAMIKEELGSIQSSY